MADVTLTPKSEPRTNSPLSPDISSLSIVDSPVPAIEFSYGRPFKGAVATFIVGKAAEVFHIHNVRLKDAPQSFRALMKPRSERLGKDIRLREDDVEAFALLAEWLYDRPLPQFGIWTSFKGTVAAGIRLSLAALGTPIAALPSKTPKQVSFEDSNQSSTRRERLVHVSAFEDYKHLSSEELRLIETNWDIDLVESYTCFLRKSNPDVDESTFERFETYKRRRRGSRLQLQNRSQAIEFLRMEGILGDEDSGRYAEGEYMQFTLLKLILFATKHDWIALLNEALNVYRKGEQCMARTTMPTRHIELTYESIDTGRGSSPVILKHMADYAFYIGKAHRKQSSWVGIVTKHPAFLQDVMQREDRSSPVPGYDISTGTWDKSRSPLSDPWLQDSIPEGASQRS